MLHTGWTIWCVLLTLHMSACGLEISEYESDRVICSQGLSDCTMKDEPFDVPEKNHVDVRNLTIYFKLCCGVDAPCELCLVIETEINIQLPKDLEDESHSGYDEDSDGEETERNFKASVIVCYCAAATMSMCKKVEFTINHAALTREKFSVVIIEPSGISFSSRVIVYLKASPLIQQVDVPSLDEVCSQELQGRLDECDVPRLISVINKEMTQVELQFAGRNKSFPSMCIQYEKNGRCLGLNRTTIPLYSVTPCVCLQVWDEDGQRSRRSLSCPFNNTVLFQRNVWQNVSVSVGPGQMNNLRPMLWWNLSAPCRLEGEVWPCKKEDSCREMKGFRQQLSNGKWQQNSKGLWKKIGEFEEINLELSPCVKVKVKGMDQELGPFCFNNTDRWHWNLLIVGIMLLLCLTVLVSSYLLRHDFVKKWVWSWHHGGFVDIGMKCHVVLLSPPDVDDGVSESVCRLGSQLSNRGFSVSVDQWSRKEQCTLGPLPWLYSQLLELKSLGGRVVIVLTHKALERVEAWTHQNEGVIMMKREDKGFPQKCSPYSDVFTACLCLIQADKRLHGAAERFLLVTFDPNSSIDRSLPELLQGLRLFQLPPQTQALLSELAVAGDREGIR
ncbi:interleukin-17 receptor C isoform X2 [Eleginops maclovinus]|uniref:interleukin-17 receptor C isoform X2 n=1 Tax=Eleginops maclovinus TaxID=56733 RepID=UPI0030808B35